MRLASAEGTPQAQGANRKALLEGLFVLALSGGLVCANAAITHGLPHGVAALLIWAALGGGVVRLTAACLLLSRSKHALTVAQPSTTPALTGREVLDVTPAASPTVQDGQPRIALPAAQAIEVTPAEDKLADPLPQPVQVVETPAGAVERASRPVTAPISELEYEYWVLGLTVDAKFKQVRRAYWSLKSELSGGSQEATQARVAEIETAYRRLRQIHRDQTALLTPKTV